jgi:tRNA-2-methylthio-N6-dimethylallyladenosine synthase
LARRGYKEVMLLGQTVNSYRFEEVDFADLLRAVAEVEGIQRIRFTSPYPVDFSLRVLEVMASEPKLCPQVHLPVQSGSDAVLERMKRGYTRRAFVDLVRRMREAVPGLALSTDVMVGFCGESEDDHHQTLSLMDEVRFDSAFMFRYSDREITQASRKLHDDVPDAVKGRRLQEVIAMQEQHTRAAHQARVGTSQEVLIYGPSRRGDGQFGRTAHFQNALLPLGTGRAGELVRVRVTATTGRSLLCEAASPG